MKKLDVVTFLPVIMMVKVIAFLFVIMMPMAVANVNNGGIIWCLPKDGGGKTILLKEKYGTETTVDSVNIMALIGDIYRVTRKGDLYGEYPKENYSYTILQK